MPPRTALRPQAVRAIRTEPYVCPSCLVKQSLRQKSTRTQRHPEPSLRSPRTIARGIESHIHHQTRRNATNYALASQTAVGAPTGVPAHLRDLHQRLLLLQDKASSYVDLSRLQLALRSLESDDPIIRIAFLGLGNNGVRAARKLAKILLADELGDEEQWERDLMAEDDGRSILLKYGDLGDAAGVQGATSPLVKELTIPSTRLRRWRLEILITGFNASGYNPSGVTESTKELEDSILVPPVTIPNSSGGRIGFVRYPAHKALLVADGISGAIEYGRFASAIADGNLINAALSLPLRAQIERTPLEKSDSADLAHANAVSIDLAEHALNTFRANIANGAVYSEEWQRSRVSAITDWLAASNDETGGLGVKAAVKNMLTSTLSRTSNAIASAEVTAESVSTALTVPDPKRSSVQNAIAAWSEEAHRDLQVNLNTALASQTWRRTTWWRLFWRIDEVSISRGDVLRRGWLVEAEQSLAFLSGRMLEAGLASVEELKAETAKVESTAQEPLVLDDPAVNDTEVKLPSPKPSNVAELLQSPSSFVPISSEKDLDSSFNPPWPQTIQTARAYKLHEAIPAMHRKAQTLLLSSLSTMGGSGALAGWLWVASGGVALYEAGAIAALGLVWSLRRLQKLWSKERQDFVDATLEDGRLVLSHVEQHLRRLASEGGRVPISEDDKKQWEEARKALRDCEEAEAEIAKKAGSGKAK